MNDPAEWKGVKEGKAYALHCAEMAAIAVREDRLGEADGWLTELMVVIQEDWK